MILDSGLLFGGHPVVVTRRTTLRSYCGAYSSLYAGV